MTGIGMIGDGFWELELVWPVAQVSWDFLWFFQSDEDCASETGLPRS